MKRKAFTLIELLIVVAIIAILAAIAVPNFLEAQTRSKVSRVAADLRSIATAMESYYIDWNRYAWENTAGSPNTGASWEFPYQGYFTNLSMVPGLTTPLAYITSNRLADPFVGQEPLADNMWYVNQLNANGAAAQAWSFAYDRHQGNMGGPMPISGGAYDARCITRLEASQSTRWGLLSTGPDKLYNDVDWAPAPPAGTLRGRAHYTLYDPTNGTISVGNIWRFGP